VPPNYVEVAIAIGVGVPVALLWPLGVIPYAIERIQAWREERRRDRWRQARDRDRTT
jgi:hypothetical protein